MFETLSRCLKHLGRWQHCTADIDANIQNVIEINNAYTVLLESEVVTSYV